MNSLNTSPSLKAVLSLSVLGVLLTGAWLYAGPIDPPAGPVASTGKTLTEAEPRIAINATNTRGDPLGHTSPSLLEVTQPVSFHLTGYAWGENIGWINLDDPTVFVALA